MNKVNVGTTLFILSAFILWLHVVAMDRLWYFHYQYFDVPVHFLGGVVVALLFLFIYLVFFNGDSGSWKRSELALFLLVGTLAVGIGWEVFEYAVGITDVLNDKRDTAVDLLMDIAGAITVALMVLRAQRKKISSSNTTSHEH